MKEAVRDLRCPICGKPVKLHGEDMPFCSGRCRLIDLGNWASEKYVISTPHQESPGQAPEDENASDEH